MTKLRSSAARLQFRTGSPDETQALGEKIGRLLRPGDTVLLRGNLGAGKTCLARGIARGWGAVERASSPTFALINEYHRPDRSQLFHVDAYRLSGTMDAVSTGLEDAVDAGQILVIEWPERVADLLPEDNLLIELAEIGESSRYVVISAGGAQSQRLFRALADMNS